MEIKPKLTEKAFKEHINSITSNSLNAIIEIIANSYDAGATKLDITWPLMNTLDKFQESRTAIFKDNGSGLSKEDFQEIWNELSYNRIENQGKYVMLNVDGENINREVYGKNGKGRHAPFAFSNKYYVKTIKNNVLSYFEVLMNSEGFVIIPIENKETDKDNGTEIIFEVPDDKNMEIIDIRETIAARFLKDDSFEITLNNDKINLTDINEDNIHKFDCKYNDDKIEIIQIESINKSNYIKFQGISWKIGNRLIEDKSWNNLIDGRKTFSRKFNYIIDATILKDYCNENMTSFINDPFVIDVKNSVEKCIKKSISSVLKEEQNRIKKQILNDQLPEVKMLSRLNQEELGQFISEVQENCPDMSYKYLKSTTEIFIKLRQTKTGYHLLQQLAKLSSEDYDELSEILKEWDIHSAKLVLDEIKWRLDLLNELRLKINDPATDELHELQPLFEKGLWIFGPEYESIEFTSNKTLTTVVEELFDKGIPNIGKPRLRPDFVAVPYIYASDSFDDEGEVEGIDKILIVELKKGGFNIGLDEMQQAQKYIQQLVDGNYITDEMTVKAYVLGSNVNVEKQTMGRHNHITIFPKTYNSIISRAEKRLFNLDKKIRELKQIDKGTDDEIINEILSQDIINIK